MRALDDVTVGQQLEAQQVTLTQPDLLRYAGASGDWNPLHHDPDVAAQVSPTGGIIAHGMLSMGHVSRVVSAWAGGAEHVRELSASFRAACPVGATLTIGGEVVEVDPEARTATLAVWAVLPEGGKVVDRRSSRAVVALA